LQLGYVRSPSCRATSHAEFQLIAAASGTERGTTAAAEKIALPLRRVLQRMREDGLTAANATARQAEAYTNPLVRVDHTGRIHVLLGVTSVDAEAQSRLEEHQAHIDIMDPALRLIQAWVPFHHLEEVAALPFVQYVRPPSYVARHQS
jgi:hypothetical protein